MRVLWKISVTFIPGSYHGPRLKAQNFPHTASYISFRFLILFFYLKAKALLNVQKIKSLHNFFKK